MVIKPQPVGRIVELRYEQRLYAEGAGEMSSQSCLRRWRKPADLYCNGRLPLEGDHRTKGNCLALSICHKLAVANVLTG